MTNYKKKVFHPSLGICTITAYDRKNDRITMTSKEGNQSSIPSENMDKAGVRELMDSATAKVILDRIFHPTIEKSYEKELADFLKMRNHAFVKMEELVDVFIYLMNWKYVEGKSGMKNQECLNQIQKQLCEELADVLDLCKERLVEHMISCYQQQA